MLNALKMQHEISLQTVTESFYQNIVEIDNFDDFIEYIENMIDIKTDDIPFIAFSFNFKTKNIVFLNSFESSEMVGKSYVYMYHNLKTVTSKIRDYLNSNTAELKQKLYDQLLKTFNSKALNLYKKSLGFDSNFKSFKNNDILFFDLNDAGMKDYQIYLSQYTLDITGFDQIKNIASYIKSENDLDKLFTSIFLNRNTTYDTYSSVEKFLNLISTGLSTHIRFKYFFNVIDYLIKKNSDELMNVIFNFFRNANFEFDINNKIIRNIKNIINQDKTIYENSLFRMKNKLFANNKSFSKMIQMIFPDLINSGNATLNILDKYSMHYVAEINLNDIENIYSLQEKLGELYIDNNFFKNSFLAKTEQKEVLHNFLTFIEKAFSKVTLSKKAAYTINLKYQKMFGHKYSFDNFNVIPNKMMISDPLFSQLNSIIYSGGRFASFTEEDAEEFQNNFNLYPISISL